MRAKSCSEQEQERQFKLLKYNWKRFPTAFTKSYKNEPPLFIVPER